MSQETAKPQPPTQMQMVMRECGICQSSIFPDENVTVCSSCGLTFHAECWTENWGCAAYGCEQVNALKPREDKPAEEEIVFQSPIQQPIERLPWNFVLLFVAAAAMIPSAFS